MSEPVTSYIIENDDDFQRALARLAATVSDFRIPFGLIAKEFYQSNKKIFQLKGPGKYPDFKTDASRNQKIREVGFAYPLMVRTGATASSLLNPSDSQAVRNITKTSMELGTDVPYVIYHQSDKPRNKIPLRKVVFIDGGPLETSRGAGSSGRRETWLNIINQYIIDTIQATEF